MNHIKPQIRSPLADLLPDRTGYVGRYAPTPSGRLHAGNIRTALLAYERCQREQGTFILRIEDTDTPRTVAGAEDTILEDLASAGIVFHEGPREGGPCAPYRQSERGSVYRSALLWLARAGFLYPCRCSRKTLQSAASAPHGSDGPVYPGTCRPAQLITDTVWLEELLWQSGPKRPEVAVRFRTDLQPEITYTDTIYGPITENISTLHGDFVVYRKDGLWAYQLACAVDDGVMGITEVVRGEDLLPSASRQVAIMQGLGLQPPAYMHVPLMRDETGAKISKRDGTQPVEQVGLVTAARAILEELLRR